MDNKNLSLEGLIFEAIGLSVENNIMRITLNRPEKKNAINPVMANEIIYSLAFAAQERDIILFSTDNSIASKISPSKDKFLLSIFNFFF